MALYDLQLQALQPSDLERIYQVESSSHPFPWTKKNLESSLKSHRGFGLFSGDQLLGHAFLSFVVGEAELLLFVVDHAHQGQGLGKAFLKLLLREAQQKASSIFLEVRASNTRAINLYEGCGFCQVGERPNYYPTNKGGREAAYLFALDLEFAL